MNSLASQLINRGKSAGSLELAGSGLLGVGTTGLRDLRRLAHDCGSDGGGRTYGVGSAVVGAVASPVAVFSFAVDVLKSALAGFEFRGGGAREGQDVENFRWNKGDASLGYLSHVVGGRQRRADVDIGAERKAPRIASRSSIVLESIRAETN